MTLLPLRASIEQQAKLLTEDDLRIIGKEAGAELRALLARGEQKAAA